MEQCATIRFLTLKGAKAKDIQIKYEPVYEEEAFENGAVNNEDDVSCKTESSLQMVYGPEHSPCPICLT
jgi:hypothetical protein